MRVFAIVGIAVVALGQTPAPKPSAAKPKPAETPKFKAIWEPVNVKEDVELLSVHFTSADEGWVAGGKSVVAGGVILYAGGPGDAGSGALMASCNNLGIRSSR